MLVVRVGLEALTKTWHLHFVLALRSGSEVSSKRGEPTPLAGVARRSRGPDQNTAPTRVLGPRFQAKRGNLHFVLVSHVGLEALTKTRHLHFVLASHFGSEVPSKKGGPTLRAGVACRSRGPDQNTAPTLCAGVAFWVRGSKQKEATYTPCWCRVSVPMP